MDEYVLRTEALTKTYRGTPALKDVSLALRPGRIYGLVGRNGAGKTTLMRVAAGLSFPTGGSLRLFGQAGEGIAVARRRIGFMIESPALQMSMTAGDNLCLHRVIRGVPGAAGEDLLGLVGLGDAGKKAVRNFSLGMRQRLGVALALAADPEFLILDEPVNGLDPVGIVEVRDLLIRLCAERKKTILLSSHNLAELYCVATDYIFIDRGRVVKTATARELAEQTGDGTALEAYFINLIGGGARA